jgi:hypothetical protein
LTSTETFWEEGGKENSCGLHDMQYWTRGTTQDNAGPTYPSIKDYPCCHLPPLPLSFRGWA